MNWINKNDDSKTQCVKYSCNDAIQEWKGLLIELLVNSFYVSL